jgi:hypothetical protein
MTLSTQKSIEQRSIPKKSIVVISWDGISSPLSYVLKDTNPDFDLFIFDESTQNNSEKSA